MSIDTIPEQQRITLVAMAQTLACYAEVMSAVHGDPTRRFDMLITAWDNDGDPRFNVRVDGYGDLTVEGRPCMTMNQAREYLRDTVRRLGRSLDVEVAYKTGRCPAPR